MITEDYFAIDFYNRTKYLCKNRKFLYTINNFHVNLNSLNSNYLSHRWIHNSNRLCTRPYVCVRLSIIVYYATFYMCYNGTQIKSVLVHNVTVSLHGLHTYRGVPSQIITARVD